ncbi:hypothetical protein [Actinomadura vinacea]
MTTRPYFVKAQNLIDVVTAAPLPPRLLDATETAGPAGGPA